MKSMGLLTKNSSWSRQSCQVSSSMVRKGCGPVALKTRMSSGPKDFSMSATVLRTWAGSRTSAWKAWAWWPLRADLGDRFFGEVGTGEIVEGDLSAGGGEVGGDGLAEAAGGAGDEGYFSRQIGGHDVLRAGTIAAHGRFGTAAGRVRGGGQ